MQTIWPHVELKTFISQLGYNINAKFRPQHFKIHDGNFNSLNKSSENQIF